MVGRLGGKTVRAHLDALLGDCIGEGLVGNRIGLRAILHTSFRMIISVEDRLLRASSHTLPRMRVPIADIIGRSPRTGRNTHLR